MSDKVNAAGSRKARATRSRPVRQNAGADRRDEQSEWHHAVNELAALLATYSRLKNVSAIGSDPAGNLVMPISKRALVQQLRELCRRSPYRDRRRRASSIDWSSVERLHALVYAILVPLVDGVELALDDYLALFREHIAIEWYVDVSDRRVQVRGITDSDDSDVALAIVRACMPTGHPFPFVRCLWCSRIYVPTRTQRYHTPNCQRAESQQRRREYMRQLMRQRRGKERAQEE